MTDTATNSPETQTPLTANEARIIALSKGGDAQAFNEIVSKYQKPVYNLCYRMLANHPQDAEDAAQEIFYRAFFKLETYDESRPFSSWLFSIASHYCIDVLKKRRLLVIPWAEVPLWQQLFMNRVGQPEKSVLEHEESEDLQGLLAQLRPGYRTVLVLKYWQGMSCQEIAETLNTTVSAVKTRLCRARKKMARLAIQTQTQPQWANPKQGLGIKAASL